MKVIYKGVNPAEAPFRLTCNHCKTVIEVTSAEMHSSPDQRDGGGKYINCPTCGKYIWDTSGTRQAAEQRSSETLDRDNYYSYNSSDSGGRSGGASGPLPPPELPHYIKTTKKLSGVK